MVSVFVSPLQSCHYFLHPLSLHLQFSLNISLVKQDTFSQFSSPCPFLKFFPSFIQRITLSFYNYIFCTFVTFYNCTFLAECLLCSFCSAWRRTVDFFRKTFPLRLNLGAEFKWMIINLFWVPRFSFWKSSLGWNNWCRHMYKVLKSPSDVKELCAD